MINAITKISKQVDNLKIMDRIKMITRINDNNLIVDRYRLETRIEYLHINKIEDYYDDIK